MNVDRDHLLDNDVLSEIRLHDNGDVPNQIGSTALGRHSGSHSDVPASLSQPLPPGHHELRESPVNSNGGGSSSSSSSSTSSSSTHSPALGFGIQTSVVSVSLESPLSPLPSSSSSSRQPTQWMREQWETNYKEAAIFLEEGINNDKFTHHPRSREALPAYLMVHNLWFHFFDLGAAMVLLALGFFEAPCNNLCVPTTVHSSIEITALILVGIQLSLKTRWIGWRDFFRHKRTVVKVFALSIMFVEAVVVLIRANTHFRVSRALRPIFLIDNHFCGGVRRFIRQILQSLPPIMDMLGLVFFVMLIYSVFGFYLFGDVDAGNFGSLGRSFVSCFVLVTTANYPDVMMKSYNDSRWSSVFFISYLGVNLYFLMNLMLAVVYDAFTRIEKDKFRKLFLHKRKAAKHAFQLLVTKERPKEVSFCHFEGLLRSFKGITSPTEAYLVFKLMNASKSGYLSQEEFYDVFSSSLYCWNVSKRDSEWFEDLPDPGRRVFSYVRALVISMWFEYVVCGIVLINGIILVVQTAWMDSPNSYDVYAPWVSYFFVGLYTLEACLKMLGLGIHKYFSSYWNVFDFGVTFLGILSLILEVFNIPLFYVIILRPLRLLTLFRMKRRFRDVFGTAVILYPRLTSAMIVLSLIYYFFGIIGMECFSSTDLLNCCNGTAVETYYTYEPNSTTNAYFWLNNFQSLSESGVTLFELTVVNNWFVIMEGYAIASGTEMSRLFFMSFYVFTMIVMTIIVAFILEAFLFRIQYKQYFSKNDEYKQLSTEITLTTSELERIMQRSGPIDDGVVVPPDSTFKFVGLKSRTKEQLQVLMYTDEMDLWIAEARREEAQAEARIRQALIQDYSVQEPDPPREQHGEEESIQVVEEGEEVTTIHRNVLPDMA